MKSQYIKVLISSPSKALLGTILRDQNKEIMGFVSDVYENSLDIVYFREVDGEHPASIDLGNHLKLSFIKEKLKSAIQRNRPVLKEWTLAIGLSEDFLE